MLFDLTLKECRDEAVKKAGRLRIMMNELYSCHLDGGAYQANQSAPVEGIIFPGLNQKFKKIFLS